MPAQQTESLARRAAWLLAAKTVAYVISFALPLLLVRRLSPIEFGFYKQAFLVVNTAVALLPMGFMMSAYYFLPREPHARQGAVVANILLFYYGLGLAALALLTFWPDFLTHTIGAQDGAALRPYAPLIGLAILLWIGSSFLEVVSVAHQEAQLSTLFIVNAQLTKTAFLFGAAWWLGSVRALLWAAILQGVVQAMVLQWYLNSRWRGYWRGFDANLLRRQLSYALPLGGAGLLYQLLLEAHNYFVSARYGAVVFGAYSLGSFAMPLVGIIGTSVSAVLIPRISRLEMEGARREIITITAAAMRKLAALYFPIYAFFLVLGREIVTFLFTEKFAAQTWPIFAVNITLIPFLVLVSDPITRAYQEHRFYMIKARLVLVPTLLAALWWGTQHLEPIGIIALAVSFYVLDRLIEMHKACRIVGATWRDLPLLADLTKIALAATISGLVAAMLRPTLAAQRPFLILLACGVAFTMVYALSLWLLGALAESEKALLRRYLKPTRRLTLSS